MLGPRKIWQYCAWEHIGREIESKFHSESVVEIVNETVESSVARWYTYFVTKMPVWGKFLECLVMKDVPR
jgi:hypothetical protein